MNRNRASLALVVSAVTVALLLGVVVPGAAPEAQAQDATECPAGFALLDDGVTCEGGASAPVTSFICFAGQSPVLFDGIGQICLSEPTVVTDSTCPPGFMVDDALGFCALFLEAEQKPDRCPEGAIGAVDECYIRVAKGPREALECEGDAELVGDICVIEGEPPRRGAGTCPVGRDIVQDGCYRLVSKEAVCPEGTERVDGLIGFLRECRLAVELIPGPLLCEAGFGLVDGRCLSPSPTEQPREVLVCDDEGAELAGDICVIVGAAPQRAAGTCPDEPGVVQDGCYQVVAAEAGECPGGAVDVDGECRVAVELIPGSLLCDAGYGLVDGRCLSPAPAEQPREVLVCDDEGAELAGDICVIVGAAPQRAAGTCPDEPGVVQDGCYQVVAPDTVCPDRSDEFEGGCRVAVALIPGGLQCETGFGLVGGGRCIAQSPAVGEVACPEGSVEDDGGVCRKPVRNATGAFFCADERAALNGRSCVFTAPTVQQDQLRCELYEQLDPSRSLCLAPPGFVSVLPSCAEGLPNPQTGTCQSRIGANPCPIKTAVLVGTTTCAIPATQPEFVECDQGVPYLRADADEWGCVLGAQTLVTERSEPAVQADEGETCTDSEAFLSRSSCFTFAFEDPPTFECAVGLEIMGDLCVGAAAVVTPRAPRCSPTVFDFDTDAGFCSFELAYATIEITKTLEGDAPEETFEARIVDRAGTRSRILRGGETVSVEVLAGGVRVSELGSLNWRLRAITCDGTRFEPPASARFEVVGGQRVLCEISNVAAPATLNLDVEVVSPGAAGLPEAFDVKIDTGEGLFRSTQVASLPPASSTSIEVPAGPLVITPQFVDGWTLQSIECDDADASLDEFSITTRVGPGLSTSCTLRVVARAASQLNLTAVIADGAGGANQFDFEIEDVSTGVVRELVLRVNEASAVSLNPGRYQLRPATKAGIEVVSSECQPTLAGESPIQGAESVLELVVDADDADFDCVFAMRSTAPASLTISTADDGADPRIGIADLGADLVPLPGSRVSYSPIGADEVLMLDPGPQGIIFSSTPGWQIDSVDCGDAVVSPFDTDGYYGVAKIDYSFIVSLEAGATTECILERSVIANAPTITFVREVDGLDASPESGVISADEIVVEHAGVDLALLVGTPQTVLGIVGTNGIYVDEAEGWQRAQLRCLSAAGDLVVEGVELTFVSLALSDAVTCTITSRLISQADGAQAPTETATPSPTATSTPAPTATPMPTATPTAGSSSYANYATTAISYPDGGFSLTPTPQPDEVRGAVVPTASTTPASAPLVATGTNAAPLAALAIGLLGVGSCLHVAARRADES